MPKILNWMIILIPEIKSPLTLLYVYFFINTIVGSNFNSATFLTVRGKSLYYDLDFHSSDKTWTCLKYIQFPKLLFLGQQFIGV
jgi:hypothetical protein